MKVFAIVFLCMLAFTAVAQDRYIAQRRAQNLPPQLIENPDTHTASGLAQSPYDYPINIGVDPLPRGSIIGLYGMLLRRNGVSEVLIMNGTKEYSLRVAVNSELFPKLEKLVFKLPEDITGEVLVSAIGLTYSNWVRFYVE
jgi:hypothetical protein